jgi:hypothetical protein
MKKPSWQDRRVIGMIKYVIYWKHPDCDWEEIDEASTYKEAAKLLEEYRLAYGIGAFKIRREK